MQQIQLWLEMSWHFPILCSAQPVKGHFNTVDVYISFVAKKSSISGRDEEEIQFVMIVIL